MLFWCLKLGTNFGKMLYFSGFQPLGTCRLVKIGEIFVQATRAEIKTNMYNFTEYSIILIFLLSFKI